MSGPDRPFDRKAWLPDLSARQGTTEDAPEADPDESAKPSARWTVRRAFEHYESTALPGRKGEWKALSRTGAWKARALADKRLGAVTREDVRALIAERAAAGRAANTIRNDLFTLSALFTTARERWSLDLTNPVHPSDLPPPPAGRQARLQDAQEEEGQDDEARLRAALAEGPDAEEMSDLLDLALDTGMRRGELIGLLRGDVRREGGVDVIFLPAARSKCGARYVTLSDRAAAVLRRRAQGKKPADRLFTLNGDGAQYRHEKARVAAGLPHLRWHDLRHEGISRMASKGLTVGELQAQSGYATAQVLLRYVNARTADIKAKLG